MLAIRSLVPLLFLNSAWIWKFTVHILLKPALENLEHYSASVWDECNCAVVWTFFDIAFLWNWNENWPFPVLWPLLSFPNLLVYWVQHFHSIIFQDLKERHWNSITSTSFVPSDAFSEILLISNSTYLLTQKSKPKKLLQSQEKIYICQEDCPYIFILSFQCHCFLSQSYAPSVQLFVFFRGRGLFLVFLLELK